MPFKAKVNYPVMLNLNQNQVDQLTFIMNHHKIQKNSEAVRFCIEQTFLLTENQQQTSK